MEPKVTTDEYFGGCPQCGKSDGYLNVSRSHIGVCHEHRTKWPIGANLFSSWKDETEEDWRRNADKLTDYSKVDPIYPEPTEEERQRMEAQKALDAECRRIDKGYGVELGPNGPRAIEKNEDTGIPF